MNALCTWYLAVSYRDGPGVVVSSGDEGRRSGPVYPGIPTDVAETIEGDNLSKLGDRVGGIGRLLAHGHHGRPGRTGPIGSGRRLASCSGIAQSAGEAAAPGARRYGAMK